MDPKFLSDPFMQQLLSVGKKEQLMTPMVPPAQAPQGPAPMSVQQTPIMPPMPQGGLHMNPYMRSLSMSGPGVSPQTRARDADLNAKFKQLLLDQEQGIEKQDQLKGDFLNSARPDLTGAGFIAEHLYGAKGATQQAKAWSGMSPEERVAAVQGLEAEMNKQRATMSNQVQHLIDGNNSMKMAEINDKNSRFMAGQDMRLNMAYNKEINEAAKPAYEVMNSVAGVEDALTPDAEGMVDLNRVTAALSNAARLNGEKGVLTDQDTARQLQPTLDMHLSKWSYYLQRNPDKARIPADQVQQLLAAIQVGKQNWGRVTQTRMQATTDKFYNFGLRPEIGQAVNNQIMQPLIHQQFQTQQAPAPKPRPQGAMPPAEALGTFESFKRWKTGQ